MKTSPAERQRLFDEFQAALAHERELFEQAKGKGPGQPGHSSEIWNMLLAATSVTNKAAAALREATRVERDF